jgi:hypothetical protein
MSAVGRPAVANLNGRDGDISLGGPSRATAKPQDGPIEIACDLFAGRRGAARVDVFPERRGREPSRFDMAISQEASRESRAHWATLPVKPDTIRPNALDARGAPRAGEVDAIDIGRIQGFKQQRKPTLQRADLIDEWAARLFAED